MVYFENNWLLCERLHGKGSIKLFKDYKPGFSVQTHEGIFMGPETVTITSMQHNAIISLFLPLKKTYGFLNVTTHYWVLNMHLDVTLRVLLPGLHCVFPTTLLKLVLFPYFTEKESAALWGGGRKGGARTQRWKGRPRPRSTTLTALTSHMVVRWKHTTQADFLHAACLPPLEGERLQFSHQL